MAAKATRRDGKLRARLIPVGRDAVRRFKACARTRRDSGHEQLDYGQARAANSISSRRERRRHRPAALLLSSVWPAVEHREKKRERDREEER
jgi:hypothetical protein